MSTNFLQFNPSQNNQQSDATYSADATRTGGVAVNQLLPSPLLNKVWFQPSTFVAALAAALAAKGYTVSDANISVLEAVLANILTNADMPLPVAKGGTGVTSPALVAGTGISVTGSFPDQTISTSYGDPVPVGHGGTGQTTIKAAGIPQVVAVADILSTSGAISPTTIYTPAVAGRYRFAWQAYSAAGSVGTALTVEAIWTQGGTTHTVNNFGADQSTDTQCSSGTIIIYPDSGTAVQYAQSQSFGSNYDLHVSLEAML